MDGRADEAADVVFARAAERYRESFADAPPGSWGRPIGAMKARVLAGDWEGAEEDARRALEVGSAEAESPIGRYAACLALLVLERDEEAVPVAPSLREDESFPKDVASALFGIASRDPGTYDKAVRSVLRSFEKAERPPVLMLARGSLPMGGWAEGGQLPSCSRIWPSSRKIRRRRPHRRRRTLERSRSRPGAPPRSSARGSSSSRPRS